MDEIGLEATATRAPRRLIARAVDFHLLRFRASMFRLPTQRLTVPATAQFVSLSLELTVARAFSGLTCSQARQASHGRAVKLACGAREEEVGAAAAHSPFRVTLLLGAAI